MCMDEQEIDFLEKPSHDLIRNQIKNIKGSYSHPWDLLAELTQNSVDAIRRYQSIFQNSKKDHFINLKIDSNAKSVEIMDSGVGFPTEINRAKILLSPHGTDKYTSSEIGQKGIGLKLAIFSCDKFILHSKTVDGEIYGTIEGALSWVERSIGDIPKFKIKDHKSVRFEPEETFTHIVLEKVNDKNVEPIFEMRTNRLVNLLRTKTAIGNTRKTFEKLGKKFVPTKVKLTHCDRYGDTHCIDVPFEYQTPLELIEKKDCLDLEEFIKKATLWDDSQKAKFLRDKTLYNIGIEQSILYFACFVPSRDTWDEISKKLDLKIGTSTVSEDNDAEPLMGPGIFVATRGMPTGIKLDPPITGAAGYWPNMLILLEEDGLDFDIGRKSLSPYYQRKLKNVSREIFNQFIRVSQYTRGASTLRSAPSVIYEEEKRRIFEELERLNDLGLDSINYLKYPDFQEAAVVAIFHELIGAKILQGYYPLKQGYKSRYDLWARYRIELEKIGKKRREELKNLKNSVDVPIVIEFKYKGDSILRDVSDNRKFFEDIDLIVCWDFDQSKFNEEQVNVRVLCPDEVFFYGSNYELEWPGAYNLGRRGTKPMLVLRRFIEDLIRQKG